MQVAELASREDVIPFVRFEKRAVEDKQASIAQGKYVAKDIDYALITPPYSKDVIEQKVDRWLAQLKVDQQNGRIPSQWIAQYEMAYEAWKKGQEMPLNGTPIKGWGIISPAQQETLIRMHILTVEELANINDEGKKRIGMGASDLKNKADIWLKQLKKGASTLEIAALKKENDDLKAIQASLAEKVEQLTRALESSGALPAPVSVIGDILDDSD
jgi:hypothetical protein